MTGSAQLRALSQRLKDAGTEGGKLRRQLYANMNDAVVPLAREIGSFEHLAKYMPPTYAAVLAADLAARISKLGGLTPRVEVIAKARQHRRKIKLLNDGLENHPVYAQGPRSSWRWVNGQTDGFRAGFFSDAVKDQTPYIREKVLAALAETAKQITDG
jgi:hypothetical protein